MRRFVTAALPATCLLAEAPHGVLVSPGGQPLPFTGFDFADLLLGLPQSSSVRFGSADTWFRRSSGMYAPT